MFGADREFKVGCEPSLVWTTISEFLATPSGAISVCVFGAGSEFKVGCEPSLVWTIILAFSATPSGAILVCVFGADREFDVGCEPSLVWTTISAFSATPSGEILVCVFGADSEFKVGCEPSVVWTTISAFSATPSGAISVCVFDAGSEFKVGCEPSLVWTTISAFSATPSGAIVVCVVGADTVFNEDAETSFTWGNPGTTIAGHWTARSTRTSFLAFVGIGTFASLSALFRFPTVIPAKCFSRRSAGVCTSSTAIFFISAISLSKKDSFSPLFVNLEDSCEEALNFCLPATFFFFIAFESWDIVAVNPTTSPWHKSLEEKQIKHSSYHQP